MKLFTAYLLNVKKVLCFISLNFIIIIDVNAQVNQSKAEKLTLQYLSQHNKSKGLSQNIQFKPIKILRSAFQETKAYRNLLSKVDSLKLEGKHIDSRIAKMKTATELNEAKKDSYRLSKELTVASEQLIDFITSYKGQQTGWLLKARNQIKGHGVHSKSTTKTFYLNKELTQVDSVR